MKYKLIARICPTVLVMLAPFYEGTILCHNLGILNLIFEYLEQGRWIFQIISFSLMVFAVIYFLSEWISVFSKWVFQFHIFQEDEIYMPTTDLLIYKSSCFSDQYIDKIREKIFTDFHINLYDRKQQAQNEQEGRKLIVDAVRLIRNLTRKDLILLDFNIRYGFFRNLLGGLLFSICLILLLIVVNLTFNFSITVCVVFLIFECISFMGAFLGMKVNSQAYARQLFTSYMAHKG